MNSQSNSMSLNEFGYSKEQVNAITKSIESATSGIIISGVVRSGKSPISAKIIKKFISERRFKAKRQRREIRNRK